MIDFHPVGFLMYWVAIFMGALVVRRIRNGHY